MGGKCENSILYFDLFLLKRIVLLNTLVLCYVPIICFSQRTIEFFDPDYDRTYCYYTLINKHIFESENYPFSYKQFFSDYAYKHNVYIVSYLDENNNNKKYTDVYFDRYGYISKQLHYKCNNSDSRDTLFSSYDIYLYEIERSLIQHLNIKMINNLPDTAKNVLHFNEKRIIDTMFHYSNNVLKNKIIYISNSDGLFTKIYIKTGNDLKLIHDINYSTDALSTTEYIERICYNHNKCDESINMLEDSPEYLFCNETKNKFASIHYIKCTDGITNKTNTIVYSNKFLYYNYFFSETNDLHQTTSCGNYFKLNKKGKFKFLSDYFDIISYSTSNSKSEFSGHTVSKKHGTIWTLNQFYSNELFNTLHIYMDKTSFLKNMNNNKYDSTKVTKKLFK